MCLGSDSMKEGNEFYEMTVMKSILVFITLVIISGGTFAQNLPFYLPKVGLIAWYPFTGNADDSSGSGNNGTAIGGAALTIDRFGNMNSAYTFNGSTSEITTALQPPSGNAPRTVSCWFKYDSLPHHCDNSLAMAGYGFHDGSCSYADMNFSMEIYYSSSSGATARVDGICISNAADGVADTLNNDWHFFAAVYDPSFGDFTTIKLYIDGEYKATHTGIYGSTTAVITDTTERFCIGAGHYAACRRFFYGSIDDIGVWNRALSEDELSAIYHTQPTAVSDSFAVFTKAICPGPAMFILPRNYSSLLRVKSSFGDGTSQIDSCSAYSGDTVLYHTYTNSGIYNIKHVLFNGSAAIDSVQYNYNYTLCSAIPLQFFFDNNGNCVQDTDEAALYMPVTIEVDSNGVTIDTLSATSGLYYTAYGSSGDIYSFRVLSMPAGFYVGCPSTGIVYDTLGSSTAPGTVHYISFQCSGGSVFDLGIHAIIPVTGNNDQWANVYVQNAYCAPTTGTITLHYSPKYAGGAHPVTPAPVSTAGNNIVWSISSLSSTLSSPVHLYYAIWSGGTLLPIGDTVQSYFSIAPGTGDADTTNNTEIIIDTVRAGCDPNAIYVKPGCMVSGILPTQLQYTITFENTGNDTAHNIYVMDTLPDYVDANSMRLVMASHEMYVSKLKIAGHNMLKFDFPKINLRDSSHHGECDGAIIYTINTKPGLTMGTDIMNRAGIYFDVNDVVMTNEAHNVIGCPVVSVGSQQLAVGSPVVYPNPAFDVLNIKADNDVFENYTITNSVGAVITTGNLVQRQTQINIKSLPAGLYFINLKGAGNNVVRNFVKM